MGRSNYGYNCDFYSLNHSHHSNHCYLEIPSWTQCSNGHYSYCHYHHRFCILSHINRRWKRLVKDLTSNVSGGIPRHVKVYDINGELIEEYKGTFDIETTNNNYILFDDENGLRHIIYFTTGTVIIDELGQ